jgi:hypothetical protein
LPVLQPLRASIYTPKPSRKQAQSVSQLITQQLKKPRARTSVSTALELLQLAQNEYKLIEISNIEDSVEEQAEEDEEAEDYNAEEQEEQKQEEQEQEEQEQESSFKFQTTWKAICGKENLPGIRSAYFIKGAFFIIDIKL